MTSQADPTTIDVDRAVRRQLIVSGFVFCSFTPLLILSLVRALRGERGSLVLVAGFAVVLAWVVRRALPALRHARHRLPALLLDADGLECAYGRIRWFDVQAIGRTQRDYREPGLITFALLPGTVWQSVDRMYSAYLLKGRDADGFRIREWAKPQVVEETLSRYLG